MSVMIADDVRGKAGATRKQKKISERKEQFRKMHPSETKHDRKKREPRIREISFECFLYSIIGLVSWAIYS